MRCLCFQQLYIPIQRTCKLPLWIIWFITLIIHLIKAATIFQQNTYLQLSLPVRACSSLVRRFLWQDFYSLPQKCYVPHVCAQLAGYRSCFHMLWPTPQNALATSLQVSWKKKKKIRRGQIPHCNNSLPPVPTRIHYMQPTRYQQPWQQSCKMCLNYIIATLKTVHLSLGTSTDCYTDLAP